MANVVWLSEVVSDAHSDVYSDCHGGDVIAVDLDTGIAYQGSIDDRIGLIQDVEDFLARS